ncbi:DUF397 domain-containing protein [Actinomadura sp. NPDC047616]|uniref:DUF397 domain-containing protein n=1 Tax=Actinomadura sp. NPDC047616 TaxID=3155914 RepID=UPI0033E2D42A
MHLAGAVWRKSTRSGNNGGECVEVAAPTSSLVGVRDSKNPDGGHLLLAREAWVALTNAIKDGRHDL